MISTYVFKDENLKHYVQKYLIFNIIILKLQTKNEL